MHPTFQRLMREATRLTSAGQLRAATAAIQRALRGGAARTPSTTATTATTLPMAATAAAAAAPSSAPTPASWGEQDAIVLDGCVADVPEHARPLEPVAGEGAFIDGSHTHAALTRRYKLYVPAAPASRPPALVVMLHGCTQDPDDFAAGTGMNERAREQGFLVLYPAQAQNANPSRCWNWFKHNHQGRNGGEAAVIASMTQAVMRERGVDPARVYIAGLSAGGAMAALVAAAYPDLYAAVGVHSGLAPGAARSLPEGLAAMRAGAGAPIALAGQGGPGLRVPAIVFHGDRDATVHPKNGDQVIAAVLASTPQLQAGCARQPLVEEGVSLQGQRYTRTVHGTDAGPALAELWVLHGAGHAWSGGQAAGSYTDPQGPDASSEMLRFFFRHAAHGGH